MLLSFVHVLCSFQCLVWGMKSGPCVGTLKDRYIRKITLLWVPRIQHASHASHMTHDTCYLAQVPHISTWGDLTRSLAGLGRRVLLPFSLTLM